MGLREPVYMFGGTILISKEGSMADNQKKSGYGFTAFKPATSGKIKARGIVFFIILTILILVQAFYWLFANTVKPFVLGMPFSMFFIVFFIFIEFVVLVILYFLGSKDTGKGGDA